ncbi:MAG: site-specific integrase [Alphaproteobacteria bacterium]|nr:site-specific integrase [Alphaproteobacteria bacterium]
MARQVRDAVLESREARKRLKVQSEPHWRGIDTGLHLGYRRRSNGGSWIVRRFTEAGKYIKHKLGVADDFQDANGTKTLNYKQALKQARDWSELEVRIEAGVEEVSDGSYTVADAMRDYLAQYSVEGKGLGVTKAVTNAHILPALGAVKLDRLTTKKITAWVHNLASAPARLRTGKTAKKRNVCELGDDPEAIRRRRASTNRVLTVLKAALNYAWRQGRVASDMPWRKVKPFKNSDVPIVRYLTEAECVRLINTCQPDLRAMVQAALFTGCRYGELVKLKASDFNPDAGTLAIRTSKSGKPRHVVLADEAKKFFHGAIINKESDALIFTHEDGTMWGKSHPHRPLQEACMRVKIKPAISFHILRHTHGSLLAMKGVPMPVIAKQLGHADTRMTERHYAHLSPSYVADTIRQNFPIFGVVEEGTVASLASKNKGKKK